MCVCVCMYVRLTQRQSIHTKTCVCVLCVKRYQRAQFREVCHTDSYMSDAHAMLFPFACMLSVCIYVRAYVLPKKSAFFIFSLVVRVCHFNSFVMRATYTPVV